WNRLAKHFGRTLKGFFYDEHTVPSNVPWSEGLAEAFQRSKGYDIRLCLPSILIEHKMYDTHVPMLQPEATEAVLADYNDVWTSMLAENFHGIIRKWCNKHNILSVGHQGSDDRLATIFSVSGAYPKNASYSDMPGIDVIWDQVQAGYFSDFARLAGSKARLSGCDMALSESFAAMGHGVYPDEMRYIAEHQIVRGINKFFVKLANYNPQKSFFFHPPELSDANPMMKNYGDLLNSRIERICRLLAGGKSLNRVCIYIPMTGFYRRDTGMALEIEAIAEKLAYNQIEYDYVWDDDIASMEAKDAVMVNKRGLGYSHLILPPGSHIDSGAAGHLRALADCGGSIIEFTSDAGRLTSASRCIENTDRLVRMIRSTTGILKVESVDIPVVLTSTIMEDGTSIHYFLNESNKTQCLRVTLPEKRDICEVDLNTWKVYRLDTKGKTMELTFSPGESKMLLTASSEKHNFPYKGCGDTSRAIPLDKWRLVLPDGKTQELVSGLQSWEAIGFGDYSGFMRYCTEFEWDYNEAGAMLSMGRICYAASIYLDGNPVGRSVFTPFELELEINGKGEHTLEIHILNTLANSVCGTESRYRELEGKGLFAGTYAPKYIPIDRKKLTSGLFGPVVILPIVSHR
ncbi:MAG: glycosyl hydrolase, partial [bacterium]|nr:glycosyl hydrolase [bacterium]